MINIMIYPLENHHHLEVDQHIRDVLINLHDNIHIFQRIYGHEVPINSYTSHLIRNSMIDFVTKIDKQSNHWYLMQWISSIKNPLGGRQVDICEFEASLVCRVNSRTSKVTQRNPVLKNKQTNKDNAELSKAIASPPRYGN